MKAWVHPTAEVEEGVALGPGTKIWSQVHVRGPSRIGRDCIVGEKSYIAYDVEIGDRVKINAFAYLCAGLRIEDGVMIAAGTIFTNDRWPRATTPDLAALRPSEPDETTGRTTVRAGATIGARAVIGTDLEIGRFAMVGMGAIVTRDVPDHHLVIGQPARSAGIVCRCGRTLSKGEPQPQPEGELACGACGATLWITPDGIRSEPGGRGKA
ncbi:MAG: N-acetyltransferase [Deltaproteobacteria bacterium]|jgi:acetyltransferase-like isoleucine patch superfamily enzyme|nr:N-acetyltransferase [Deltaproteobacteria bacterium]